MACPGNWTAGCARFPATGISRTSIRQSSVLTKCTVTPGAVSSSSIWIPRRARWRRIWKTAIEGFLEAYHIIATHPQALRTAGDANAQYDIFGRHVNRFVHAIGYSSPHLAQRPSEAELFEALGRDPASLPPGASARAEHAKRLRAELGAQLGVDLSDVSTSEMLDSIEYFLFPNACFFPGISIPLIYRFTPLDVDHCVHEILLLHPVPESGERPPPAEPIDLGLDDDYQTIPDFPLGFVLDQDTENFKRQRAGIKASRKGAQTLGNYQEARIRHLHQTLDEYLAG